MKNSSSYIPRIIVMGIIVAIFSYVTANIAYLAVLDEAIVISSHTLALDYGKVIGGDWMGVFYACGVAIATAGSANGYS